MNQLKGILKYTTVLFRNITKDVFINVFWLSLHIGVFSLPLAINIPSFFFIISVVFGVLHLIQRKKKCVFKKAYVLLIPLYFIITLISLFYSKNFNYGLSIIERSLPLFFLPIIFLFLENHLIPIRGLFCALLLGLICAFLVNFSLALYNSVYLVNGNFILDFSIAGGYSFYESFSHGGSHFIGAEFSKFVHPSYISMYILSVLLFVKNEMEGKVRLLVLFVLFLFLFLLASRSAFIILILMGLITILRYKERKTKWILICCVSLVSFIFLFNPRINHFYSRLKKFNTMKHYKYATSEQARILTYDAGIKLISEAPLWGYGLGDANDELIEKYLELDYIYNYNNKFNAHNQYIQTYLQSGIMGLLALILPLIVIAFMHIKKDSFSFFVIFVIMFMFESVLVRFNGIAFFAFIMPLLLKEKKFFTK